MLIRRVSLTQYPFEKTGAMAPEGHPRIMDIVAKKLHEGANVILGSKNEVHIATSHDAA